MMILVLRVIMFVRKVVTVTVCHDGNDVGG